MFRPALLDVFLFKRSFPSFLITQEAFFFVFFLFVRFLIFSYISFVLCCFSNFSISCSVIQLFLFRFDFINSTSLAALCRQSLRSFHFLSIYSLLFSNSFGYSSIHKMLNLFPTAILHLTLHTSCFSILASNCCCLGAAFAFFKHDLHFVENWIVI